jgi:membrane protease subunit (stomatin/prohibitin family)
MALGLARARANGVAHGAAGIREGLQRGLRFYTAAEEVNLQHQDQHQQEGAAQRSGDTAAMSDLPVQTSWSGLPQVGAEVLAPHIDSAAALVEEDQMFESGELAQLMEMMADFEEESFSPWFNARAEMLEMSGL